MQTQKPRIEGKKWFNVVEIVTLYMHTSKKDCNKLELLEPGPTSFIGVSTNCNEESGQNCKRSYAY